ncbi:hypothetical protein AOQ84DRAFT_221895 [Glonium stellatum]|uniref:Uncharacterized protein n=1 Tax=Glonium stellatum TaxID=574774 RepID=A0A8E2F1A9_9PEZI|nr:hypothetical protein AOQ84DRAFT_221895 [Glonium stellatum]
MGISTKKYQARQLTQLTQRAAESDRPVQELCCLYSEGPSRARSAANPTWERVDSGFSLVVALSRPLSALSAPSAPSAQHPQHPQQPPATPSASSTHHHRHSDRRHPRIHQSAQNGGSPFTSTVDVASNAPS